jgi:hypothetical protein
MQVVRHPEDGAGDRGGRTRSPRPGTAIHNSLGLPFPARWETVRVIWWAAGGPDGKPVRGWAGPELAGCRAGLTATTRGAYRLLAR